VQRKTLFEASVLLPASVPNVFAFHENPHNISAIAPKSLKVLSVKAGHHAVEGARDDAWAREEDVVRRELKLEIVEQGVFEEQLAAVREGTGGAPSVACFDLEVAGRNDLRHARDGRSTGLRFDCVAALLGLSDDFVLGGARRASTLAAVTTVRPATFTATSFSSLTSFQAVVLPMPSIWHTSRTE